MAMLCISHASFCLWLCVQRHWAGLLRLGKVPLILVAAGNCERALVAAGRLRRHQLGVAAPRQRHQLLVAALLQDASVVHQRDDVRLADGAQPVRHHHAGAAQHDAVQRRLHHLLRLAVKGRSGLVQQQDLRAWAERAVYECL